MSNVLKQQQHQQVLAFQTSSQHFIQLYNPYQSILDAFAREYVICYENQNANKIVSKRVLYKNYLVDTQQQKQSVFLNLSNFLKLADIKGFCSFQKYHFRKNKESNQQKSLKSSIQQISNASNQLIAVFEYPWYTLSEFIHKILIPNNKKVQTLKKQNSNGLFYNIQFYLFLLEQLLAFVRISEQIGIQLDDINMQNVLICQVSGHYQLKFFYDQRQRSYSHLIDQKYKLIIAQQQQYKIYWSPEKLQQHIINHNQDSQFYGSSQCVFQIGMIMLDIICQSQGISSFQKHQQQSSNKQISVNFGDYLYNSQHNYFKLDQHKIHNKFRKIEEQISSKLKQQSTNPPLLFKKQISFLQDLLQCIKRMIIPPQQRVGIKQLLSYVVMRHKQWNMQYQKTNTNQDIGDLVINSSVQYNNLKNSQSNSIFYSLSLNSLLQSQQLGQLGSLKPSQKNRLEQNQGLKSDSLKYSDSLKEVSSTDFTSTYINNRNPDVHSNFTADYKASPTITEMNKNLVVNRDQNQKQQKYRNYQKVFIPRQQLLNLPKVHPSVLQLLQKLIVDLQFKINIDQNQKNASLNSKIVQKKHYYDGSIYYGQIYQKYDQKSNNYLSKRHGNGIYVYTHGDLYFGTWKSNSLVEGTYIFKNGESYQGSLNQGKQGFGRYRYSNGNVYEGEWKNDLKQGKGIMNYPNGDIYQGYWLRGKKQGKGVYKYSSGIYYQGMFSQGKKSGLGVMIFEDGTKIEGNWAATHIEGPGKTFYSNGDYFQGQYHFSQKDGRGYYLWDNCKYQGQFRKDSLDGVAKISYPSSAEYYEGSIRNGKRQGHGTYHYQNGDFFDGQWRNDQRYSGKYYFNKQGHDQDVFQGKFKHGQISFGTLTYGGTGQSYHGQFKEGQRNGVGQYRDSNGTVVFEGHWKMDQFIGDRILQLNE